MSILSPLRVHKILLHRYKLSIKLKHPNILDRFTNTNGFQLIIPRAETELKIYIKGFGSPNRPDSAFEAITCTASQGYDFSAIAYAPDSTQERGQELDPEVEYQAVVLWDSEDLTTTRRIKAVEHAASFMSQVVPDKEASTLKANHFLREGYQAGSSPDFRWFAAEVDSVDPFITDTLTEQQRAFAASMLRGVDGRVAVLQGFPGSGKTRTLAHAVAAPMLCGPKVEIVPQPNRGVNAPFDEVVCLVHKSPKLQHFKDKLIRQRNEPDELQLALALQNGRVKAYVPPKVAAWLMYRQHLRAKADARKPPAGHSFKSVLKSIRATVMRDCLVGAATTFVAYGIEADMFNAEVLILDEAGMATDRDLLQAFVGLVGSVLLLILAGDNKQLGPVI
ncbi:hypothetical protein CKM354_000225500 [Cercospora kikuchii]|uniref:DNA2/NAM7 helicase helicase domain-containing protein n=1 Tax=Cercospora kikuchii TaxID=84275 RepID=A0A9P3CC46_9PEZI|nr:uncharacterized protein CKM354_000225500 [Cercospora kikuchii]GIZ38856.1 hypothetical protein CKM354_000225500 [Cercospora kikuchii]